MMTTEIEEKSNYRPRIELPIATSGLDKKFDPLSLTTDANEGQDRYERPYSVCGCPCPCPKISAPIFAAGFLTFSPID